MGSGRSHYSTLRSVQSNAMKAEDFAVNMSLQEATQQTHPCVDHTISVRGSLDRRTCRKALKYRLLYSTFRALQLQTELFFCIDGEATEQVPTSDSRTVQC